ncbi:metallophosphoesterase family protein [Paenibacillus agricola]|uniref:Metallophosphoesterase family protein n=1 Tax=Paenibacillus agricola TaxID=2716264 RepID=A0ABX0JLS6_9BACL|nr:metallophosphoesterase family protein [Paenibacillus agricola]NHN35201.1 metallophosphoesterase family protein [Paenibacillus agricola]
MSKTLKFRADGSFTIVQFTDMHWKLGDGLDQQTRRLMDMILSAEQPDLAILTGDVIQSGQCLNGRPEAYAQAVQILEEHGVPWAAVFGNHDKEYGVTGEELMEVQRNCPHCLTEAGPGGVSGLGNFMLRIGGPGGSSTSAVLYLLDSHEMAPSPVTGYDWIKQDQIEWYTEQSAKLEQEFGRSVPSLAFFHIPLPEYNTVWNEQECCGSRLEKVACPPLNSGFFTAALERGDITGMFAGHDHVNDYCGELHGIRLCYGRATGYNTYPRNGTARGARMIRLLEGERKFQTWIRLDDGTVIGDPSSQETV